MMVQKTKLIMEVDMGAAVTVIRENTYRYLRRKGQAPPPERIGTSGGRGRHHC
jgi:hypothetical protein